MPDYRRKKLNIIFVAGRWGERPARMVNYLIQ